MSELFSQITLHPALVAFYPALLIIGMALKETPKVADWLIVWILIGIGALAGIFAIGFTITGIANGIISAGMAITSHQLYKQTTKRN